MKIAVVQMDVQIGQVQANLDRMISILRETSRAGAELTIFPECALTGYCFDDLAEAVGHEQMIPGPATEAMTEACRETGSSAIWGMLEPDGSGGLFNAAALVQPEGLTAAYRKVHLPYLGIDRKATFGDRTFAVHDVGAARVGMNICYDSAFPEASRTLALLGADLIALPTNWPPGAEVVAEHVIPTRAMENGIYYAAANRVGQERGVEFIGRSSICGPNGKVLAAANHTDEEILYAEIDPETARNKRVDRIPGEHAIDRMADRRPEMYELLIREHRLERPGRTG